MTKLISSWRLFRQHICSVPVDQSFLDAWRWKCNFFSTLSVPLWMKGLFGCHWHHASILKIIKSGSGLWECWWWCAPVLDSLLTFLPLSASQISNLQSNPIQSDSPFQCLSQDSLCGFLETHPPDHDPSLSQIIKGCKSWLSPVCRYTKSLFYCLLCVLCTSNILLLLRCCLVIFSLLKS